MGERWAVLLYGLGISGGANVIFEHAVYAVDQGVKVTFIARDKNEFLKVGWHSASNRFRYLTLDEAKGSSFDVVIATEWRSAYDVYNIKANKYVYFVQSIESKFYKNHDGIFPYIADSSYNIPFNYITEAGWIRDYLNELYGINAKLVRNGIDKRVFSLEGKSISSRKTDGLRFLVEGSTKNWLKNVPKTIEICREAGVEELWLVTPDEVSCYHGADRVFSKVNMEKMGDIYRSCDVLVKLSLVEGMFGPPLEMFHCGGTAVVYGIEGADEYIVDNENAIVVETNDETGAIAAIKKLICDSKLVSKLKNGAKGTALKWYGWNEASESFYRTVNEFKPQSPAEIEQLHFKCESGANLYRCVEQIYGAEPSCNRIKEAIDVVNNEKKRLVLYGAGNLCKSNIILFSYYDVVIDMVVVSEVKGNPKSVLGHKVVNVDEIGEVENYIVYITTEQYYDEIYRSLVERGFKYIV